MKTYTEDRIVTRMGLRDLCIAHDWYTLGTNEEYETMFAMLYNDLGHPAHMSVKRLAAIAEDIKRHSDTEYETEDIMSAIANISISYFMPAP